jgi:putative colanic acid biosynthesis UDP-glucose lipid carrier transferase
MRLRGGNMNGLAHALRPLSDEQPGAALLRILLAPAICVLTLVGCAFAFQEPFVDRYVGLAIVAFAVTLQVFGQIPLGREEPHQNLESPGQKVALQWLAVVGILVVLGLLTGLVADYSRKLLLCWFAVTPFALQGGRLIACQLLARFRLSSGRLPVIVGAGRLGETLAERMLGDPCIGGIAGFFDDRHEPRLQVGAPGRLGGLDDVAPYVKRNHVSAVYIALPVTTDERIQRLVVELRDTTASIYFVPDVLPFDTIQGRVAQIGGMPLIAVLETPFYGVNAVLKRATDLVVAGIALALLWPVMLLIAAAVKLSSPGPALFRQRRYGLDGEEFQVFKFRTMTCCEDGGRVEQARKDDARVTRIGFWLRRLSLDELPQLLNVMGGSMSVVGPRPHAVAHNEQYRRLIQGYMLRHKVKPGITGWAQVNGLRGETASVDRMRRRIEHDLEYLRHWSLVLDLRILARTALVVLRDPNAY